MKKRIKFLPVFWVWLIFLPTALNNCTWLVAPPADDQAARQLISSLALQNSDLEQAKGLLNVKLEAKGAAITGRAAWAASVPNRLRIEWLNMVGQPVASLAGDGRTLTIRTNKDKTVHRLRQSRTALDQVIHIPIGVEDLVAVLAGRPLLPDFVSAQEMPAKGDERIIVLKNRWHMAVARFWLDGAGQLIKQEIYEADGTLRYRLVWLAWNKDGAFVVPKKVMVEAGSGQILTLSMERFWPNTRFSPEMFIIQDPAESDL